MDSSGKGGGVSSEESQRLQEEIKKLKLQVLHRDNEIMILLTALNKLKAQGDFGENALVPVQRADETQSGDSKKLAIKQSGLDSSMIISNNEDNYNYKQISFPKYEKHKQEEEEKEGDTSSKSPENLFLRLTFAIRINKRFL